MYGLDERSTTYFSVAKPKNQANADKNITMHTESTIHVHIGFMYVWRQTDELYEALSVKLFC